MHEKANEKQEELEKTDEEVFREYIENLDLNPEDFDGEILDVGSGSRQFAKWARDHNVSSEIYSVEPVDEIINNKKIVREVAECFLIKIQKH